MKFLITMMAAVAGFSAVAETEPPMMGWSTWNAFNMDISEEIVGRQAEALVEKGLADCGYRYVCMDDGWSDGRSPNNPLPEYEALGTGTVTVPEDGEYVLELNADWRLWVKLDGREIYAMPDGTRSKVEHRQTLKLAKGEHRFDFRFGAGSKGAWLKFRLVRIREG